MAVHKEINGRVVQQSCKFTKLSLVFERSIDKGYNKFTFEVCRFIRDICSVCVKGLIYNVFIRFFTCEVQDNRLKAKNVMREIETKPAFRGN